MGVSKLIHLLGDPPPEPFPVDWAAVEDWLGLGLPAAYKEIGSRFGPWYVGDWLWVEVPCAEQERRQGYDRWLRDVTRNTRLRAREDHVEIPKLYPQEGGLLAWGHTRGEEVLFWDTSASSTAEEWPVVFYVSLGPLNNPWRHTGLSTTDFLIKVIEEGIPFNEYSALGPLSKTARRTSSPADLCPWTPPAQNPSTPEDVAARRRALHEGSGMAALRVLVPAPERPQLDQEPWQTLFESLGTILPRDYVDLMNTYGPGQWSEELRFPPPQQLAGFAARVADAYRQLREKFPRDFPLAAWPEPGGFLAFADSVDGDYIGWLTSGEPDAWPVIVWPRHYEQGPALDPGLVDTLLAVLRGQPVSGFAGLDEDDDPLEFAVFEPWD